MDQRDPFGRETGEDPLGAMGWASSARAAAPSAPPRPAPPQRPVRVRTRRRRTPLLLRVLVPPIAVVVAVVAGAAGVARTTMSGGAVSGPVAVPRPPSLLGAPALRAALRQLPNGRLQYLRVSSDRLSAQVLRDGRLHIVSAGAAGDVRDAVVASAVRAPRLRVNAAAPGRIHRRLKHLAYLVLGAGGWNVFTTGGRHYRADLAGRHLHRAG